MPKPFGCNLLYGMVLGYLLVLTSLTQWMLLSRNYLIRFWYSLHSLWMIWVAVISWFFWFIKFLLTKIYGEVQAASCVLVGEEFGSPLYIGFYDKDFVHLRWHGPLKILIWLDIVFFFSCILLQCNHLF